MRGRRPGVSSLFSAPMFTVDATAVVNALKDLDRGLPKETDEAADKAGKIVASRARTHHRFHNQTGNLMRAIQSETAKAVATAYIDPAKAPYGEYIHDGRRGWAADRFLDKALADSESKIVDEYDKAYSRAIEKAGLA